MGFKRPLVPIPLLLKMGPRQKNIRVTVKKRLLCRLTSHCLSLYLDAGLKLFL